MEDYIIFKRCCPDFLCFNLTDRSGEKKKAKHRQARLPKWEQLPERLQNGFTSGTAPQTLLAVVGENNSPTVPENSIPQTGAESQEDVTVNPFASTVLPESVTVETVVSENLRPEIAGNAARMGMLRDKFGADGTAALTRQIKAEIERTGTVGKFGVLFSDGGMAVEEALGVKDDGRQYSIKRTKEIPYSNQMDAYYGKRGVLKRDDDIFVMTPDEKLEKIGLENKPIFMLKSNLNKSTREAQTGKSKLAHGIPEHIIRNLQTHIKDAVFAIMQNGRISLISNERVKTQKEEGAPLLIGIDPNSSVDGKPANEIKSIYGRDNFIEWIYRMADNKAVTVLDEKRPKRYSAMWKNHTPSRWHTLTTLRNLF